MYSVPPAKKIVFNVSPQNRPASRTETFREKCVMLGCGLLLESFSYDRERIGKLLVTSKHQNNYFLLFLSTTTNYWSIIFLSQTFENDSSNRPSSIPKQTCVYGLKLCILKTLFIGLKM